MAENAIAMRPQTQTQKRAANGAPTTGSRPVQFGTEVSKKPATMAGTKPNTSSCTCHSTGDK